MTTNKPLILLGEAWGRNEAKLKTSFVGASGIELLKMLHEANVMALTGEDYAMIQKFWTASNPEFLEMIWQMHPEVYRTNVFNLHPPGNRIESLCGPKDTALPGFPPLLKSKYVRSEYAPQLERLADELLRLDPNLIVALGNTPLWALAGTIGVSKLRGTTLLSTHTVTGFKCLGTYHPAAVLRQWELRPTAIADLMKAGREAAFPEIRRPEREIWIEPTLEDIERFCNEFVIRCKTLSVDIETAGNQITCIGLAPHRGLAIVVPFFDTRRKGRSYWPTVQDERAAWDIIKRVLQDSTIRKVFQNGLYDIAFLWRSVGIAVRGATHDTLLLHHALQPESLKSLGYLGSIYANESAWKTERKSSSTIKRDE